MTARPSSNRNPYEWVRNQQWVEIRQGADVVATGEVIAYQPQPTVTIRRESGSTFDYPAHHAYPAERPNRTLTLRLEPDDGRRWQALPGAALWELMNRRADGGDDGPAFAPLDWVRDQGVVVLA